MSFTEIINYDNASNFTFDSTFVEFVGSVAKLKKLALFPGEVVGASFREDKDLDRSVGSITTTLVGSAVHTIISDVGYCDLRGGNLASYFDIDPANALLTQQGTVRLKYTPNYSGSPAADRHVYAQSQALGNSRSNLRVWHESSTGRIRASLTNSSSSSNLNLQSGPWVAVSGTEYEIEFDYDFGAGTGVLYVDGIALTPLVFTITASWTVGATAYMVLGAGVNPASSSGDGLIRDLQLFNTVQHTANFSGEIPRVNPIYFIGVQPIVPNSAIVTDALISYTGVESVATAEASIQHVSEFIGADFYYDGAAWVTSNSSLAQSNVLADVTANITDLDISAGGNYLPKLLLSSPNGLNSPEITSISIDYDFFGSQGTCDTSVIYGYILQDNCIVITAATLTFTSKPYYQNGNLIVVNETITALTTNGYFELALPVSNSESNLKVVIKMTDEEGKTHTRKDNLLVTNVPSNLLEDIVV